MLFALIFGAGTFTYSLFLYYSLNNALMQDFDNSLYNYSIDVAQSMDYAGSDSLLFPSPKIDTDKIFPFSSGLSLILVRDVSGVVLSQNMLFNPQQIPFVSEVKNIFAGYDSSYTTLENIDLPFTKESDTYRLITFPIDDEENPTLFLQIAAPMSTFDFQLHRLYWFMGLGFPIIILTSIILGLYFVSRALRPVKVLIDKTNEIGAQQLSKRLPVPVPNDEIRELALTQNRMLDRIEKAFSSQEKFVANASHQLLTPLTILKGEIEISLKKQNADETLLNSLLEEVNHLAKLVKDMLLLARLEAGTESKNFSPIAIEEVIFEVMGSIKKITQKKNIQVKMSLLNENHIKNTYGDRDLVFNLIFNIVENAAKYSPADSHIDINVNYGSQALQIDISDNGPGIDDDKINLLFERFNRLNRDGREKGYGLGLAIAKKITDLHGFELKALGRQEKTAAGAQFRLLMPYSNEKNF